MTMPNPQKEQIGIIHAANVLRSCTEGDSDPYLYGYAVTTQTKYMVKKSCVADTTMHVVCLGIYPDLQVAVFGEWQGPPDQQPSVAPERIKGCFEAFLVRPATMEEQALHGCRKAVVLLNIIGFISLCDAELSHVEEVGEMFFQPTTQVGFYNPLV